MTTENAKAQGLFIPNWWIAILAIPVLLGVLWFFKSLSDIQAAQAATDRIQAAQFQNLKDTLEFRLKNVETQAKINDEHLRLIENRLARIEGKKGVAIPDEQ